MSRLASLCLAALLAACATTDVTPVAVDEKPDITTDEAGLWQAFDRYEQDLQRSALVERDEALNAYVRSIVCEVAGEGYCNDMRLYVVRRPYFNATMSPNGLMEVWTGLLLRAENEAQAAFVIGHEFVHYRERHSLQRWRSTRNLSTVTLLMGIGGALAGAPGAGDIGQLAGLAALYGYGRDQEREADELGFDLATEVGYADEAAARLWRNLVAEVEASDSRQAKRRIARANIFSTHPLTQERIDRLDEKAAALDQPAPDLRAEEWANAMAPHIGDWLQDDLVRRNFGEHLHLVNRLMENPAYQTRLAGELLYRRGEAYRLRREEGDLEKARADYEAAVTKPDAPALAWRRLGDALKRDGERGQAAAAYRTYLEKAPDASDRLFVEQYIEELGS